MDPIIRAFLDSVTGGLRAKGELFGELQRDVADRFGLVDPVDRREILDCLDALLADDLA